MYLYFSIHTYYDFADSTKCANDKCDTQVYYEKCSRNFPMNGYNLKMI